MVSPTQWARNVASGIALDAAGLIALADLPTIARRTAVTGSAALSDVLVLCPGIHKQQDATSLNGGEYPITANMTSGYVFRTENPGTVAFFQLVGKTGHLTTLSVRADRPRLRPLQGIIDLSGPISSVLLYVTTMLTTICALIVLGVVRDFWGLAIFGMLILGRSLNVYIVRQRCEHSWHGVKEPGKFGDLLVLLSKDRWIRVIGLVDDLKTLTSGEWLRNPKPVESSLEGVVIVIVYLCAALASNATQICKILILVLFMANAGLLTLSNALMGVFYMKGLIVKPEGLVAYERRLDMVDQLIKESGDKSWAIKIGLVNEEAESQREQIDKFLKQLDEQRKDSKGQLEQHKEQMEKQMEQQKEQQKEQMEQQREIISLLKQQIKLE